MAGWAPCRRRLRQRHTVTLLLLLWLAVQPVVGLRFLFLPLMGGNSPSMDLMGVAAALQERGHEVAVVVTASGLAFAKQAAARHSSNSTAEGMRYIQFKLGSADPVEAAIGSVMQQGQHPGKFSSLMMLTGIQAFMCIPCADLVQDKDAMQELRSFNADAFMGVGLPMMHSDSCGCLLSHLLGAPFVDLNGHPLVEAPPTVPQFGAGTTEADLHTVLGFTKNLMAYTVRTIVPTLAMDYGQSNPWVALRKAVGLPRAASSCPLTNLLLRLRGQQVQQCSALLEVLLSSFLLEHPRPLAAHQTLVGPGTPRPPHPIQPPEVAAFAAGAADGLVLVAFGSTIQTVTMAPVDLTELVRGFAALAPVRVLWALTDKGLPAGMKMQDLPLGANTRVVPWVDYNDVLGHPNMRVFVSHCGVHSVNEAAYHGMPVVALPLHFEQAHHAERLVSRGVGVISYEAPAYRKGRAGHPSHYTAEGITGLIRQVLSNASYTQAAQGIATALQRYAAQRHPYQRAADEVELAVRTAHVRAASAAATQSAAAAADKKQQQQQRLEL